MQFGATILTGAPVQKILTRNGCVQGVVVDDGREFSATVVLSNADPKRTFLGLVDASDLPGEFVSAVRGIKMDGPSAKVNLILSEEPRVNGMMSTRPEAWTPASGWRRSTISPLVAS